MGTEPLILQSIVWKSAKLRRNRVSQLRSIVQRITSVKGAGERYIEVSCGKSDTIVMRHLRVRTGKQNPDASPPKRSSRPHCGAGTLQANLTPCVRKSFLQQVMVFCLAGVPNTAQAIVAIPWFRIWSYAKSVRAISKSGLSKSIRRMSCICNHVGA